MKNWFRTWLFYRPVTSRRLLVGHLLWGLAWIGVAIVAMILSPSKHGHGTHQQLGLPPCPSVILSQRPCPGCGLTTSFTHMAHWEIVDAFMVHPFGPILFTVWGLTGLACLYGFVTKQNFNTEGPIWARIMAGLAIAFFVFGFGRMAFVQAKPNVEKRVWGSNSGSSQSWENTAGMPPVCQKSVLSPLHSPASIIPKSPEKAFPEYTGSSKIPSVRNKV